MNGGLLFSMLVESVGYCWVGSRFSIAVRTLMVVIFFPDDNGSVEGEFLFPHRTAQVDQGSCVRMTPPTVTARRCGNCVERAQLERNRQ